MSDKRPWTKGPWLVEDKTIYSLQPQGKREINRWWAGFSTQKDGAGKEELLANVKLASKSPELAELGIKLATAETIGDILECKKIAKALLKECGWE